MGTSLALSKVTLVSPITLSPSLSGERWATRALHSDPLWLRINARGLFQVLSAQWKLAIKFIAMKAAIIANLKTPLLFDASLTISVQAWFYSVMAYFGFR